jgi:hypothetical protein
MKDAKTREIACKVHVARAVSLAWVDLARAKELQGAGIPTRAGCGEWQAV